MRVTERRQPMAAANTLNSSSSMAAMRDAGLAKNHDDARTMCLPARCSDVVLSLNVGGTTIVQTLRSTLTVVHGSLLAARFSPTWEHSLPRDKDGNIFIDHDPDVFLPLLSYLRIYSASQDHLKQGVLPMTPFFYDKQQETSFRALVDSLLLTNVLYNYEVHRFENEKFVIVSKNVSVFDYNMVCLNNTNSSGTKTSCVTYCLARPMRSIGDCHVRHVQSFQVSCDFSEAAAETRVVVGWTLRGDVDPSDEFGSSPETRLYQSIVFDTKLKTLKRIHKEGKWYHGEPLPIRYTKDKVAIRCGKRLGTNDLEWYADGKLIASTDHEIKHGSWKMSRGVLHLGLVLPPPEEYEWIPYIKVYSGGRCHFSAIELQD